MIDRNEVIEQSRERLSESIYFIAGITYWAKQLVPILNNGAKMTDADLRRLEKFIAGKEPQLKEIEADFAVVVDRFRSGEGWTHEIEE